MHLTINSESGNHTTEAIMDYHQPTLTHAVAGKFSNIKGNDSQKGGKRKHYESKGGIQCKFISFHM